jgi:hypothetical protein
MRVSSLGCGRSTAREALSISSPNHTLSRSFLYHSYAGAWTGVYFPTRFKAPG